MASNPFDPSPFPFSGPGTDPGGGHTGSNEALFPRELTTDLVARAEDPGARGTWQLLALAAGLAVLALGMPLERLWAEGQHVARLEDGFAHPLPALLHRGLTSFLRSEAAAFVLSALALALQVFLWVRLVTYVGFERGTGLAVAVLTAATPLVALGARLALATSGALVGALLVVDQAFRVERERGASRARLAVALGVAWALAPENALLAPAAAMAAGRAWRTPLLALGASLTGLAFLTGGLELPAARELSWRVGGPILGLGAGWLGLASLRAGRRPEEESPPPRWLGYAAASAIPASLIASWSAGLASSALLVVAGVGLADLVQRQQDRAGARGLVVLLLLVQLAASAAIQWGWQAGDDLRAWRSGAERALEPDDLVITVDPAQAHLLGRRYGLEVLELAAEGRTARLTAAWSSGRRTVLVLPVTQGTQSSSILTELEAQPNVLVLDPDGSMR